jgi:hypothetical protein
MSGHHQAFNGLVLTPLVRNGEDWKAPKGAHVFEFVYKEMFSQVLLDYRSLGDIRTLKEYEIKFLYERLRPTLKQHHKTEQENRSRRSG